MSSNVNISIDDVSPHPRSSIRVVDRCFEILEKFPECKFTLFIPISYWRTMKPGISTQHPLQIDLFSDFCDELRNLPKSNFEVGYHGFHHGIPGKSDNDEMRYMSYERCNEMLKAMFSIVEKANLADTFSPILRPPAWRMSEESFDACRDMNIELLALSSDEYEDGSLDYKGKDIEFKNVVYFNSCPPEKPLQLFPNTEIVYHACDWDKNFLDHEKTTNLIEFLKENEGEINFSFISGLLD